MRIIPFWILHRISDLIFFLMYFVLGYRKSVVNKNLKYCFPEKNTKEIARIRRRFYRRLCDVLLESIKGYTLTEKQLLKRFVSYNHEATFNDHKVGKSVFILTGHLGSWEWGNAAISYFLKHTPAVLYKPISNPFVEEYVKKQRSRFGAKMISIYKSMRFLLIKKDNHVAYYMVADQFPTTREKQKMVDFFGNITPFLHGPENFSKQLKAPVYYLEMRNVKRGYYAMDYTKLTDDASLLQDNELTQLYASHLEATIRKQPEDWLWSHKRWKEILYSFE